MTTTGVRRTETYVYNSLHWAFPMAPLLAIALGIGGASPGLTIAFIAATTIASASGLAVLHTELRDADLLPASSWDSFRTRHLTPAYVVWAVTTPAAAVLVAQQGWRDLFATIAVPAYLGAVLALPLLGRRRVRPFVVGLLAIALAEVALWAGPFRGEDDMMLRVTATYWVGFIAAFMVGFAVMFRNVLQTTRELERARDAGARLAVAEERLRFSRDLHDVFGRTLSAVALKAELGARQAEGGRPEAAATMREVQAIATDALAEVRDVVRGYRQADLATEVAGARALLESAGITVSTMTEGGALSGPVARVFAWVVREAATNILRHADATHATIALRRDDGGATLTITNDLVPAEPASPVPEPVEGPSDAELVEAPWTPEPVEGSGLAGLAERLAEVGGRLDTTRGDGRFVLTATVDAAALARLEAAEGSRP